MNRILNHKIIGKGDPIILLHGFLGSSSDWDEIAEKLSKNYLIIIPDLPGFGASKFFDINTVVTYQTISNELEKLIKHLGIPKLNICGYSMGGRVALSTYFAKPALVSKLIIISADPGISDTNDRDRRLSKDIQLAESIKHEGPKTFLEKWYQLQLFQSLADRPELLSEIISKRLKDNDPNWVSKILIELSPGNVPDLWPQLSSINVPLLYIAGSLDSKYVGILEKIKKINANFTTAIIDNVGHNSYIEDSNSVLKFIIDFIEN